MLKFCIKVIPWCWLHFHSIFWELIDGIWPDFAYALILTRSRFGLSISMHTRQFLLIYNRVMALDSCRNFVSAQYLKNKLMEFDQILHMHWYWQDLGWDCYASIFRKFIKELWSLIDGGIWFLFNILRTDWWNLTKFCICIDIDKI